VIITAELAKSVLRESWSLCGQVINWGAQHAVSVLAPGYRTAVRSRIAPLDDLRMSEQPLLRPSEPHDAIAASPSVLAAGSRGRHLHDRSHYAAHQGQPTQRNRFSPGLVYEAKLNVLAAVDSAALSLRICFRHPTRSLRGLLWYAACCGRRLRAPAAAISSSSSLQSDENASSTNGTEALQRNPRPSSAAASSAVPPSLSDSTTRVLISTICGCPATEYRVGHCVAWLCRPLMSICSCTPPPPPSPPPSRRVSFYVSRSELLMATISLFCAYRGSKLHALFFFSTVSLIQLQRG
jgi:hypothetical protein